MHQKIALFISQTREDPTLKRILFIILLHAITPAIFIIIYMNIGQRQTAVKTYEENLVQIARFSANSFNEEFLLMKSTLSVIASLPEIRSMNAENCTMIVKSILDSDTNKTYTALGATDKDGNIICTTLDEGTSSNIADREHFQEALQTKQFTIGNFRVGDITKKPIIVAAVPIIDSNDQFSGIVFSSINLKSFNRLAENVKLPPGFTLTVLDDEITIISRYPDFEQWIGFNGIDSTFGKTISAQTTHEGTFSSQGLDEIDRLYAFSEIKETVGHGTLTVAIGAPESEINRIASQNLWKDSIILLVIIFSAVLILSVDLRLLLRRSKKS
jgi:hypothetical protein